MRKVVINITVLLALLLIIFTVLIKVQDNSLRSKAGFIRKWINSKPKLINTSKFQNDYYNTICGATSSSIFLSGKDPRVILRTNFSLSKFDIKFYNFPVNQDLVSAFNILLDSPFIKICVSNLSTIISCNIYSNKYETLNLRTPTFTQSEKVSNSSMVVRAFDSTKFEQYLKKVDLHSGKTLVVNKLIQNQQDGGFSTDGKLCYDPSTNHLIYIQFFQNRFYCLDSNIYLHYTSNTIDTTENNILPTRKFFQSTGGSILPSVPLKRINLDCFVFKSKIFVLSSLRSNNENSDSFERNSVIDIYNINNGNYIGSFYIPNKNEEKVKSICIKDRFLIALYRSSISIFELEI